MFVEKHIYLMEKEHIENISTAFVMCSRQAGAQNKDLTQKDKLRSGAVRVFPSNAL